MTKEKKDLNLAPLVVDLGEFKQVKNAVKEFLASESRLDILVNNAALYATSLLM